MGGGGGEGERTAWSRQGVAAHPHTHMHECMHTVEEPLILRHRQPHSLTVGVGQGQCDLASDTHVLGMTNHARSEPCNDLLVRTPTVPVISQTDHGGERSFEPEHLGLIL